MSLAARGSRNMDNGIEKIEDDWLLAQVRRQARKVYIKALVSAAALTLLVAFIPRLR